MIEIHAVLSTYKRLHTIPGCLASLLTQEHKLTSLMIYDDCPERSFMDSEIAEMYNSMFYAMGIQFYVKAGFGSQVLNFHDYDTRAHGRWIFRVDDDTIIRPEYLRSMSTLLEYTDNLGAVGGPIVTWENLYTPPPENASMKIEDTSFHGAIPCAQRYYHQAKPQYVDHLVTSYIYKCGIAEYNINCSPASHGTETMHTHDIKLAGKDVMFIPREDTTIYHLSTKTGGVRQLESDFKKHDEDIFNNWKKKHDIPVLSK